MSVLYPLWKNALMQGTAGSALTGTGTTGVYAMLVDVTPGGYVQSNTHQFLNAGATTANPFLNKVGTAVELTPKTFVAGTFDAADITFTAVPTGNNAEAIILYVQNAGANSTWQLVAYIDAGTGLPVTPNGGNIIIAWNESGIFTL